jgi:hypothetical protein
LEEEAQLSQAPTYRTAGNGVGTTAPPFAHQSSHAPQNGASANLDQQLALLHITPQLSSSGGSGGHDGSPSHQLPASAHSRGRPLALTSLTNVQMPVLKRQRANGGSGSH